MTLSIPISTRPRKAKTPIRGRGFLGSFRRGVIQQPATLVTWQFQGTGFSSDLCTISSGQYARPILSVGHPTLEMVPRTLGYLVHAQAYSPPLATRPLRCRR